MHSCFRKIEFLQNIDIYEDVMLQSNKFDKNLVKCLCKSIRMLHQKGFHPIVRMDPISYEISLERWHDLYVGLQKYKLSVQ